MWVKNGEIDRGVLISLPGPIEERCAGNVKSLRLVDVSGSIFSHTLMPIPSR
jgi:hypothetical protein